jgi:KDO2-lipid IV(A) lauroyltransferase
LAPDFLLRRFCLVAAQFHFWLRPRRCDVVINNLLPACAGQRGLAKQTARRLYRNFALKLLDLWRVESGLPLHSRLAPTGELKLLESALGRGRGVVLVTVHLGNWELGGLLLAQLGLKLTVLTLAEPDDKLTELRAASRARLGIDTVVIGHDGFEFVEVIKRLQEGGTVAILLDRPRERNSANVQLFGQPFAASAAAAELARAAGCAVIGVDIVREGPGYVARILPEVQYEHRSLGSAEGRRLLTQEILQRFEPEIRTHLDQWYQFVPVWPDNAAVKPPMNANRR